MIKFYRKHTPNYSLYFKFVFFILVSILVFSCNKEDEIGLDLIPQKEMLTLELCDSILLKSYTVHNDTFSSKNKSLSLIGSYIDPVFGYTAASFLTEIRLSTSTINFESSSYAKSLTLNMVVNGSYGDKAGPTTLKIYKVLKKINTETAYIVFDENEYVSPESLLTTYTFTPSENGQDTLIKVPLPLDFANALLSYNEVQFDVNVKGLYVTTESDSSSSILYINLLSPKSNLDLQYRYYNGQDSITSNFSYLINSECQRKNIFVHDYIGTEIESEILLGENSQSNLNYIQSIRGVNTVIEFPDLKEILQGQNIAVMKAELTLYESENYISTPFPACQNLNILVLNDSLEYISIPDIDILGTEYFGGKYVNNSYVFNVTAYTQGLITRNIYDNSKLIVSGGSNTISANRVVINSGSSETNRIKLKIYYIKL
jgi:hypothetical protein